LNALDAADATFRLLTSGPQPLSLHASHLAEGLPDRPVPLDELRVSLLHPANGAVARNRVWAELVRRAPVQIGCLPQRSELLVLAGGGLGSGEGGVEVPQVDVGEGGVEPVPVTGQGDERGGGPGGGGAQHLAGLAQGEGALGDRVPQAGFGLQVRADPLVARSG